MSGGTFVASERLKKTQLIGITSAAELMVLLLTIFERTKSAQMLLSQPA